MLGAASDCLQTRQTAGGKQLQDEIKRLFCFCGLLRRQLSRQYRRVASRSDALGDLRQDFVDFAIVVEFPITIELRGDDGKWRFWAGESYRRRR